MSQLPIGVDFVWILDLSHARDSASELWLCPRGLGEHFPDHQLYVERERDQDAQLKPWRGRFHLDPFGPEGIFP